MNSAVLQIKTRPQFRQLYSTIRQIFRKHSIVYYMSFSSKLLNHFAWLFSPFYLSNSTHNYLTLSIHYQCQCTNYKHPETKNHTPLKTFKQEHISSTIIQYNIICKSLIHGCTKPHLKPLNQKSSSILYNKKINCSRKITLA